MDKYGHDFYTAQKNLNQKRKKKITFFFMSKTYRPIYLFLFCFIIVIIVLHMLKLWFFLYFVQSLSSFYFLFRQKKTQKKRSKCL